MPPLILAVLAAVVLTAAIYDLTTRRIPNWLNLAGLLLGLVMNCLFFQVDGLVMAGKGLLLALAVYLPLYLIRGMGAGDVKLMAAVGALVGPGAWFQIFVVTALAGGATAAAFACLKRRFTETCCNLFFLIKDLAQLRAPHRTNPQLDFRNPASLRLPHGALIALGSLIFLGFSIWGKNMLADFLFHRSILRLF